MQEELTIGKLARAAGVNIESVRYYQRVGLITEPVKPATGYRLYPADTVDRILFIKRAQLLGFSLKEIVGAQQNIWFVFLQPVAFLIYVVAGLAETNRNPFDLPEAESELTAGFHTEYSGMGFSLFFIGEYTNMFIVASVATVLFLGGWHGPHLPYGEYLGVVWFFLKVYFLLFLMIMVRWTYPRVRFDQLLNFAWKYLVPFSLVNLLITAVLVKL